METHAHQVSPPCVLPLVSFRSEEVILRKVPKVFLLVVVMETIVYTCVPNFHVCYTEQV